MLSFSGRGCDRLVKMGGILALYEQEYGKLYAQEEIESLLLERQKDIGVQEKWLEEKEPEWNLLENSIYREYVKEIDLLETRKEQRGISKSVLKDKWIFCEPGQYSGQGNYGNIGGFHISLDWRRAIDAVIEDYGGKVDIPKGKWTVTDFVAYNDEEEIIMVLDEQNKQFAIVKGLDGE